MLYVPGVTRWGVVCYE